MEILELFVVCILDPIQELSTDASWGGSAALWWIAGGSFFNTDWAGSFGASLLLKQKVVHYTPENRTTCTSGAKFQGNLQGKENNFKVVWDAPTSSLRVQ